MYDDARHQEAGVEDDHTQHTRMREARGELETGILRVTAALICYEDVPLRKMRGYYDTSTKRVTAALICYEDVPSGKYEGNYDTRRKNNDRKYENW